MKNWNLIFRRTHLYLGMLLLPWMAMYALSTVLFNHGDAFRRLRPAEPAWERIWEKDYALDVPTEQNALRDVAGRVIAEQKMKGAYVVQRQDRQLTIILPNFRQPMRLIYSFAEKKLRAERRVSSWVETFARLHQRVGYGQGFFLNWLWALIVDVFCVGTLLWIATGIYLWWKLESARGWGFATIAAGVATIALLLATV